MYNSKYYTCEQIDQRLLEGYYDDAVAAGYTGSKSQYLADLLKAINYSANPTITANKVVYNNGTSGLEAGNVQEAIDELANKKFDNDSVVQESGWAEDKVMSQKAVSDKLNALEKKTTSDFNSLVADLSDYKGRLKLRFIKAMEDLHYGYYNNNNVFVESDTWFYKATNIKKDVTYLVSALSGNNGYIPQITYHNTGVPFANECITGDTKNFVGNFLCTIPSGTTSFAVHGNKHDFIPAIYEGRLDGESAFYDRSIVWFGTSIPAGDVVDKTDKENNFSKQTLLNYPSLVGFMLKSRLFNEAIGGSMVRAGSPNRTSEDKYGWYGINAFLAATCLAGNLEEKRYFIDNYESLKDKFSTPLEDNINDIKDFILDSSYEKRLVERHLGTRRKNLYVFDCGFNDKGAGFDLSAIPTENEYDRNYFIGAMKFLIRLILQDDPNAKIVLIGHYCDYDFDGQSHVCDAQEKLAKELNIPLIKMWEKININRSRSIQITAYKKWSDYNCLVDSDTPKTGGQFEFLMKDGIHPHSDATNSLNIEIANILADEINRLFSI